MIAAMRMGPGAITPNGFEPTTRRFLSRSRLSTVQTFTTPASPAMSRCADPAINRTSPPINVSSCVSVL